MLAVIAFHARIPFFGGGFTGVDIFVVSGYLIGGLILREADAGSFSLVGFYERRVRRILPALLAMLAFSAVAGWILLPGDFRDFGASLTATAAMLSNFLFERGEGYFSIQHAATPLLHTWSLAVEEQFYLAFPLLLLLVRRGGATTTRIALAAAMPASFAYSVWATQNDPGMAFYSPPSRAWEFLAGALLAAGVAKGPKRNVGDIAALIGLALLAYAVLRMRPAGSFPGINALPPVLGAVLILYGTMAAESRIAKLLSLKPLVAVGLISYSLYLWHWPLIVFGGYYVLDPGTLSLARVAMAVLAFPIAWASWRYVEQPFRKPRLLLSRRALFVSAGTASLVLGLYGAAIYAAKGLPGRFDPAVQHLAEPGQRPDYGCAGKPVDQLVSDPACRLGDAAVQPSFILWGDSHAAMYFPALKRRAQQHGVSGYALTRLGCPPLFNAATPDKGSQAKIAECHDRNAVAIKLIAQMHPRAVILAADWAAYGRGKRSKKLKGADDQDAFDAGVAALKAQGITVYLLLDTPNAGVYPQQFAKARVIGAEATLEISTERYHRATRAMRRRAADMEARGLLKVLDPGTLICGLETCRLTDGDRPLYYDTNHLNARGVTLLAPLFDPMLRSLATPPAPR